MSEVAQIDREVAQIVSQMAQIARGLPESGRNCAANVPYPTTFTLTVWVCRKAGPKLLRNGTSAAWLGLDKDRALCAEIERVTGVPATSTMLAYDRILRAMGVRRLGLVTPYLGEIQSRIIGNYAAQGIEIVAEARLEDRGNYSFATYPPEQVGGMIEQVAEAKPDAIAIVCTNFRGAPVAERIERATGVAVLDSIAVTAAHCMREMGLNPARVTGWGSVFQRFSDLP